MAKMASANQVQHRCRVSVKKKYSGELNGFAGRLFLVPTVVGIPKKLKRLKRQRFGIDCR
jgi:hypothetical protein